MKKMRVIGLFIICSLMFSSCGNFSSAESYLGNVYSKPTVLTKNNAGEDKTTEVTEEFSETKTKFGEPETNTLAMESTEIVPETEANPDIKAEVLPDEKETVNETIEIEIDINIVEKQNENKYIITENGKKFHKDNCRTIKSIKQYISCNEALNMGYEPCKICNPVND